MHFKNVKFRIIIEFIEIFKFTVCHFLYKYIIFIARPFNIDFEKEETAISGVLRIKFELYHIGEGVPK